MKRSVSFIIMVPAICWSQWSQLGVSINGTDPNDNLGATHAIAIDASGMSIAVGSAKNSDVFTYSGYAKVFDWNGASWMQRGSDFLGTDSTYEGTGSAVDLSANGLTLAVSSPWGYNSLGYKCGVVRVFDWAGGTWVQRGENIEGEGNPNPLFSGDVFGTALELSSDGNFIVVGARANTQEIGVNQFSGHVRVYNWNGSNWVQVGQDIDGPLSFGASEFGYAVSINDAGNRVAIGARSYTGAVSADQEKGMVVALEFNGSDWLQMGDTLFGSSPGDKLGTAVQLSNDGTVMAVGAPKVNLSNGATKVFDWNGVNWVQRGGDLGGTNGSQSGSDLDLSADGSIIALGEPWTNSALGATRIFQWNGTSWAQVGNTITLSGSNIEAFGSAVRLNASGSRVIIGAPFNDDAGNNTGKVQVYEKASSASITNHADFENLIAYPNPTENYFHIISERDILSYELISMDGKTIQSNRFGLGKELIIDMSDIPTGIYHLKLEAKDKMSFIKVIKN